MRTLFIIAFLFLSSLTFSQVKKDTIVGDQILIEGDSIELTLDEVTVLKKIKFDSTKEKRYYYWYWKKVHNAYPFAKTAAERLILLNSQLKLIRSKRKRKKHIKKMQKYGRRVYRKVKENDTY